MVSDKANTVKMRHYISYDGARDLARKYSLKLSSPPRPDERWGVGRGKVGLMSEGVTTPVNS